MTLFLVFTRDRITGCSMFEGAFRRKKNADIGCLELMEEYDNECGWRKFQENAWTNEHFDVYIQSVEVQ